MFKARVQNFQSIADATIEVDGFTVVTGNNNVGKSALMRAIRGVFTNPSPSFVRNGSSHATVELWFDDGNHVKWEKGPKVNRYELNGKVFDKVGAGVVPDEVRALGVAPITAGGKEEWPQFAGQPLGVLFLLNRPGSAIADAVADVERIQKLNKALKSCEKDRKAATSALKVRRKDSESLSFKRQRYEGLDELVVSIEELASKEAEARKLEAGIERLGDLKDNLADRQGEVDRLKGFEAVSIPDSSLAEKVRDHLLSFKSFRQRYGPAVRSAQRWASAFDVSIDLDDGSNVLEETEKVKAALQDVRVLRKTFASAQSSLATASSDLEGKIVELKEAEQAVQDVLGGYEECPVCGGSLDHVH